MKFCNVKALERLREGGAMIRGIQIRRGRELSVLLVNPFAVKKTKVAGKLIARRYADDMEGSVVSYEGEGISGDCSRRGTNRALCAYVDAYRRSRQVRRVSVYVAVAKGDWERLGTFLLTGFRVAESGLDRLLRFELTRVERPVRPVRELRSRTKSTHGMTLRPREREAEEEGHNVN